MRSTLLEACPQLGWPTAQSPLKQKSHKERVSGSRAEIRRRSPLGSIGWLGRSRSNLGMTNLNSSFSLSVLPEVSLCSVSRRRCSSSSGFDNLLGLRCHGLGWLFRSLGETGSRERGSASRL